MTARDDLLERVVAWLAVNGIGDTSLRAVAEGVGSSHRMLLYHFGSREGLLSAVVDATWIRQQEWLTTLLASAADPYAAARSFWDRLADEASTFAPLFFELSAAAMHGHAWAGELRGWIEVWQQTLCELFVRAGHGPERSLELARTTLALARGVLYELALGGDRSLGDAVVVGFLESTRPGR